MRQTGTLVCDANGDAYCNAEPGEPTFELCDNKDNDCDGSVDEENPEGGAECNTHFWACVRSAPVPVFLVQLRCVPNILTFYDGGDPLNGGTPEVCDRLDNDCDGIVDNVVQEAFDAQGNLFRVLAKLPENRAQVVSGTCEQAGQLSCVGANIRLECNASLAQPAYF